tara:strand:- start:6965 stop:7558 length:594 start_codon:yes stop_codon:yes gene_type:complete
MTENGKVTIVADDNGSVIRVSKNNPEFGHVRLTQEKVGFGSGGWVKKSTRSTLIHGTVEDLQAIGIADKTELPGQIVVKEQLEAFSSNDPDRDLKVAGDTGVICCKHGEPIYRKSFYSMDLDEVDVLIAHTNNEAIREANGVESKSVRINTDQLDEMVKPTSKRKKKEEVDQVDIEDSIQDVQEEELVEVDNESFEL